MTSLPWLAHGHACYVDQVEPGQEYLGALSSGALADRPPGVRTTSSSCRAVGGGGSASQRGQWKPGREAERTAGMRDAGCEMRDATIAGVDPTPRPQVRR